MRHAAAIDAIVGGASQDPVDRLVFVEALKDGKPSMQVRWGKCCWPNARTTYRDCFSRSASTSELRFNVEKLLPRAPRQAAQAIEPRQPYFQGKGSLSFALSRFNADTVSRCRPSQEVFC